MPLSAKQRHVLAMLSTAGSYGVAQALRGAQGFDASMIASLANRGLRPRGWGRFSIICPSRCPCGGSFMPALAPLRMVVITDRIPSSATNPFAVAAPIRRRSVSAPSSSLIAQ